MKGFHLELEENTKGKDYVIGDLHGCYNTFQKLLKEINFNTETDRIFSVGDLVDRGPNSPDCAELLHEPWFFAVRGNHEQMAIDYSLIYPELCEISESTYWSNGGQWFIEQPKSMQDYFVELFRNMPVMITIGGKVVIAHADIDSDYAQVKYALENPDKRRDSRDTVEQMLWSRTRIYMYKKFGVNSNGPVKGIDRVFLGHTVLPDTMWIDNICYLDTGCVFGYCLTVYGLDGIMVKQITKSEMI